MSVWSQIIHVNSIKDHHVNGIIALGQCTLCARQHVDETDVGSELEETVQTYYPPNKKTESGILTQESVAFKNLLQTNIL